MVQISRSQIKQRAQLFRSLLPKKRTRKVGPRPKYPHGLELEFQRAYKLMWRPYRELVSSPAFQHKVANLMARYAVTVTDAFEDEFDDIFGLLDEEQPVVRLRDVIRAFQQRIERFSSEQSTRGIEATQGVAINLSAERLGVQRDIFLRNNIDLIRNVTEEQRKRISTAVMNGVRQGLRPEAVFEEINRSVDIGENRARAIARDQVAKYNSGLTQELMVSNGVEKFMWSTSRDERVRESHAELEGQVFEWADLPRVDGEETAPGMAPGCRCVAVAVIE